MTHKAQMGMRLIIQASGIASMAKLPNSLTWHWLVTPCKVWPNSFPPAKRVIPRLLITCWLSLAICYILFYFDITAFHFLHIIVAKTSIENIRYVDQIFFFLFSKNISVLHLQTSCPLLGTSHPRQMPSQSQGSYTHIHTNRQVSVSNSPLLHIFGLWEKPEHPKENHTVIPTEPPYHPWPVSNKNILKVLFNSRQMFVKG